MLTVPIIVEGEWWGTLGLDDCIREEYWTVEEISFLRAAGDLLSHAITHQRVSAKRKQLSILHSMSHSSSWEYSLHNRRIWFTAEMLSSVPRKEPLQFNSFHHVLRMVHPRDRSRLIQSIRSYFTSPTGPFRIDIRLQNDQRAYTWIELIGQFTQNSQAQRTSLTGIAVDISHRKQQEAKLEHLAESDPLTGIANRRSFDHCIHKHVASSARQDEHTSLLIIDLDHFKLVNDRWGHTVGDQALCHFVQICQTNLRQNDFFARIGGEEFAILLPNTNQEMATQVAERIGNAIRTTPLHSDEQEISFTISIGCCTRPNSQASPQGLFEQADQALYQAKSQGRDQLVCC